MWDVVALALLIGIVIGSISTLAIVLGPPARPTLPPATARQLARARRRNRPDLALALARPGHDRRNWLPPSADGFEETR